MLKSVVLLAADWSKVIAAITIVQKSCPTKDRPTWACLRDRLEAEVSRVHPVVVTPREWADWEAAAAAGGW